MVSEVTDSVAGLLAEVVPLRLSVSPVMAPVTVLVALLIGMPSTVSDAFAAVLARVMLKVGSELTETEPLPVEAICRCAPEESATTVAERFKPKEFISPATVERVSPEFTLTVAVEVPSLNWKLLVDNGVDELDSEADDQVWAPVAP